MLTLIVDTGPLSHLAQTGHIRILDLLSQLNIRLRYPRDVEMELRSASEKNQAALSSGAIVVLPLDTSAEARARELRETKLRPKQPLLDLLSTAPREGGKNAGEAACIAYAENLIEQGQPCVYVDDWMGRATAHESRLVCLSTLDLLACLVRLGRLGRDEAERIVSDLLGSNPAEDPDYRLPIKTAAEFVELYQLVDGLPAPGPNDPCDGCLRANNLHDNDADHRTHFLCHLVSGWVPPSAIPA